MAPAEGPASPVLSLSSPPQNNSSHPGSPTVSPSKPNSIPNHQSQFCPNCHNLSQQNHRLERRVARLRVRLHDSVETTQTHGQRLLRAAFQEKLRQLTADHAHRTTEMLNIQKKCFEDELQLMETETQSAINALQAQLDHQRTQTDHLIFRYERQRHEAFDKTQFTMDAVQQKLSTLQARSTRLQREKDQLAEALEQKQLMIDVLASNAASQDLKTHRTLILENGLEDERKRKNTLVDSLQQEIAFLRNQLEEQRDQNRVMSVKVTRLEREHQEESQRYAKHLEDAKEESDEEIHRMGRLFASVIEDFTQSPSDES